MKKSVDASARHGGQGGQFDRQGMPCHGNRVKNLVLVVEVCFVLGSAGSPASPANVLTYHNDNFRTGLNSNEQILSPLNANSNTFGKLFTYNVDGFVFVQPLYVAGVTSLGLSICSSMRPRVTRTQPGRETHLALPW
jgi:hypothetical protein